MQELVSWGVPVGPPGTIRGRIEPSRIFGPMDAFIEQRPALDRSTIDTDRADNTVLHILDPVAITDRTPVPMGRTGPHVYSVKAVDGIAAGRRDWASRYASEVTVIR